MKTVLCIEDEPDIRETIVEELEDCGFRAIEAGNGEEGLEMLFRYEPDLVLCDINMPVLDGNELLTVLRRDHPELAEIPFIFLSANADRSHIIAGKELGADDYLTKPIDFDVLNATVKSRLNQIDRIRERHEEQLAQTQKMEAIGRLTSGVAHEFNNLLTAIRGFTEIAARNTNKLDLVKTCLADSIEAADRAATITSQLLAYSRRQISERRLVDANSVIADAERFLKPLLGPKVRLRTVGLDEPLLCKIDPHQFSQVITNLAINGRDAMPDGGELVVTITREEIDEDRVLDLPEAVPIGSYVCFAVHDSGTGIDEFTRSKMFEPFFTTKEEGEGTGLGLAVAYGIACQAGGIIDCDSMPGEGSTFRVLIPLADSNGLDERETADPSSAPELGSDSSPRKTVLVVDGEEFVRNAAQLILEGAGYTVLMAADAESALRAADNHFQSIDLLLCDILQPTTNGPDLISALLNSYNPIAAVFMTGDVASVAMTHPGLSENHNCLEKPFTPDQLERAVTEAIYHG